MKRGKRIAVVGGAALSLAALLMYGALHLFPIASSDFSKESVQSLRVTDRNGILLREFLNDEEGRGIWKPLSEISPFLQQATIAVEDRRFFAHHGVDPVAIARAAGENIRALHVRSGGSTLTQQVIRNVYHRPRTMISKVMEMWDALRLERIMSKQEILEQYLNRAPYGNQIFGAEAAAERYFGKHAADLSLAEAAFLAALPNAPSFLNPQKNKSAAAVRQHLILDRMLQQRMIAKEEYDRAVSQPIPVTVPDAQIRAPHVTEMVRTMNGGELSGTIRTTIDYPLQEQLLWLVKGHLKKLARKNVHNAALIVLDNATGEIRALIGSAEYGDTLHQGEVNGATALRQPGSALKPFMYALALGRGFTPATILADIPTAIPDHHGDYVPENYDRHFHGPVRLRTALACSYNVPAVRTLQSVGKETLLEKLRELGITSLDHDAEYYGYGLTLGNAEVSLLELTTAYMALANGGMWKSTTLVMPRIVPQGTRRVYEESVSYLITDILKDPVARRPAFGGNFQFPFMCAVKTGTTKDYKDNWTMGYTTRYTVGIWVGNFDGEVMQHVSGVSGAGPIFYDVMMYLHSLPYGPLPDDFHVPDHIVHGNVCTASGKEPTPLCRNTLSEIFIEGTEPKEACSVHRAFTVPTPTGGEETRVYACFPQEYTDWVMQERIPVPPSGARPLSKHAHEGVRQLEIVSPNSGDYFKIDPVLRREYQVLTVQGFVPPTVSHVMLRINRTEEVPFDPHGVRWQLQKGVFHFQLCGVEQGREVKSRTVVIQVE